MKLTPKVFLVFLITLSAAYLAVRLTYEFGVLGEARLWWDSPAYLRIATGNLSSPDFYLNSRPFLYPLVLKLLQRDPQAIFRFQVLFSTLAWGALAWSAAFSLKQRGLGLGLFTLVLLFSLDRHLLGWDTLILTESLSLALIALLLAGWLWLLRSWNPLLAAGLTLLGLLAALTRDTNAWLMLMQAGLLTGGLWLIRPNPTAENELSRHKPALFLMAGLLLAGFLFSNFATNLGRRWQYPFQNILVARILPNAQMRTFFADCGLPITPELLTQPANDWEATPDAFQTWRDESGKSCYVRWLVQNPQESLVRPLGDFGYALLFPSIDEYFGRKFTPLLPASLASLVYPGGLTLWLWGVKVLLAGLAVWQGAMHRNGAWWLVFGLVALELPHYLLIWHGDAADLARHALLVSVLHQFGLWLAAALTLDGWLAKTLTGQQPPV